MSNQKKATQPTYVITLDPGDEDRLPKTVCTCSWESEPDATFYKVGMAAKEHAENNPGHVLRRHI